MVPKECKRLAEVDFPVAEVSRHSAQERYGTKGHPSTVHIWWARRPLAACRAMLMALLLPDPCDVNCPAEFKEEARRLLKPMPNCGGTGSDKDLRDALLKFTADFANWDNSAKPAYLECARGLVKAAHGEEPPLVVDPFAGGGSIPLEALRIGCDAFASDLNPVACLILEVLLEDIPRHGPALAEELRRVGKQIKEEAERELAEFYPPDPDGARPIAYLWARTVRCEAVGCGAEIPLMRSFWLCKKANRRRALRCRPLADARGSAPSSAPSSVPSSAPSSVPNRERERALPLAYFITFVCYGTWLHGKNPLSVDRNHNRPGTPFVPPDPEREAKEGRLMDQPGYEMDEPRREVVLKALQEVAAQRGWGLMAAHVRTNHVHLVVASPEPPERVMNDFKAYASRRLREAGLDEPDRKRWARHGSTRYLWKAEDVEAAVHYVLYEQGEPMSVSDSRLLTRAVPAEARAVPTRAPVVDFEIFAPKSESEVRAGTVNRGNAVCPCCNAVLPVARVRAQLAEQRGGADVIFDGHGKRMGGARLLAVVTLSTVGTASVSERGRHYRLPTERDYAAVWKAQERLQEILDEWERDGRKGLCPVPDEPTPAGGGSGAGRAFSVQRYGMTQWGDLFTARQKSALVTLLKADARSQGEEKVECQGLTRLLALVLDRCADYSSSLCSWHLTGEKVNHTYGRQALPIVWDFTEVNLWCDSSGNFDGAQKWGELVAENGPIFAPSGQVEQADACDSPQQPQAAAIWFTDPPYYDAVPYADLSDFFFVWLRRGSQDQRWLQNRFESANLLTPKSMEIVQDEIKRTPDGRQ